MSEDVLELVEVSKEKARELKNEIDKQEDIKIKIVKDEKVKRDAIDNQIETLRLENEKLKKHIYETRKTKNINQEHDVIKQVNDYKSSIAQ